MDKRMLKITITQLRQIALFAVGMSLLTACGNSQSGMKLEIGRASCRERV